MKINNLYITLQLVLNELQTKFNNIKFISQLTIQM